MKNIYPKNNFISYLLILWAFFIVLFFTKNIFAEIQITKDDIEQNEILLSEKDSELTELNTIQASFKKPNSDILEKIKIFSVSTEDKDILNYIYSQAQKVNLSKERIIIRELDISEWTVSDFWFNELTISIDAIYSSENTLFSFIKYLIDEKNQYHFYIKDFSYPMNETVWNIQVPLSLTLYYK